MGRQGAKPSVKRWRCLCTRRELSLGWVEATRWPNKLLFNLSKYPSVSYNAKHILKTYISYQDSKRDRQNAKRVPYPLYKDNPTNIFDLRPRTATWLPRRYTTTTILHKSMYGLMVGSTSNIRRSRHGCQQPRGQVCWKRLKHVATEKGRPCCLLVTDCKLLGVDLPICGTQCSCHLTFICNDVVWLCFDICIRGKLTHGTCNFKKENYRRCFQKIDRVLIGTSIIQNHENSYSKRKTFPYPESIEVLKSQTTR